MIPNRMKLGIKRKQSINSRQTKLTLTDKIDLNNLQNNLFLQHQSHLTTQVIKSTPNIEPSPRYNSHQLSSTTPFNSSAINTTLHNYCNSTNAVSSISVSSVQVEELKLNAKNYEQKIETLMAENQKLKNREKVLEAQKINNGHEYYDRQITRLKQQSEKYQIYNIDHSAKIQTLLGQKQQLENISKKKTDEIRNCQKQLQKQKLAVVQLKNQLSEKQKSFTHALEQIERSNLSLSKNDHELSQKCYKLESQLKQKSILTDSLAMQIEMLMGRSKQNDALYLQLKRQSQQQLLERQKIIVQLQNQFNMKNRQSEQIILKLSQTVRQFQQERQNSTLIAQKVTSSIKDQRSVVEKEMHFVNLEEEIQNLKNEVHKRDQIVVNLELKLKEFYCPQEYHNLQMKCKDFEEKRLTSAKYYEQKLLTIQKQNEKYRLEKYNNNQLPTSQTIDNTKVTFHEILRKTIQQSDSVKKELARQIEHNQAIKEEMLEIKLKEKKYIDDLNLLSKKVDSQSKNYNIQIDVERQKFINQIDSLKRKLSTVETRLEYKINEAKQKDDFIKNTIIGRSKPTDIPFVMAELQRVFLEKERQQLRD